MLRKPKQIVNKKQKGRNNYNIRSNQRPITRLFDSLFLNIVELSKEKQDVVKAIVVAMEAGEITAAQIYAMEFIIKRQQKKRTSINRKSSKYILRIFPHRPRSKKPNETGLGRGKGAIHNWVSRVRKGQILVEFISEDKEKAIRIEQWIRSKRPIKTKLIRR